MHRIFSQIPTKVVWISTLSKYKQIRYQPGADVAWVLAGTGGTSGGSAHPGRRGAASALPAEPPRSGRAKLSPPPDSAQTFPPTPGLRRRPGSQLLGSLTRTQVRALWPNLEQGPTASTALPQGEPPDRSQSVASLSWGPPSTPAVEETRPRSLWAQNSDGFQGAGTSSQGPYRHTTYVHFHRTGESPDRGYPLLPNKMSPVMTSSPNDTSMTRTWPLSYGSGSPSPPRGGRKLEPIGLHPPVMVCVPDLREAGSPLPLRPQLVRSTSGGRRRVPPLPSPNMAVSTGGQVNTVADIEPLCSGSSVGSSSSAMSVELNVVINEEPLSPTRKNRPERQRKSKTKRGKTKSADTHDRDGKTKTPPSTPPTQRPAIPVKPILARSGSLGRLNAPESTPVSEPPLRPINRGSAHSERGHPLEFQSLGNGEEHEAVSDEDHVLDGILSAQTRNNVSEFQIRGHSIKDSERRKSKYVKENDVVVTPVEFSSPITRSTKSTPVLSSTPDPSSTLHQPLASPPPSSPTHTIPSKPPSVVRQHHRSSSKEPSKSRRSSLPKTVAPNRTGPPQLQPFDSALQTHKRPTEALQQHLVQLASPEWETVVEGLQGLQYMLHNHPNVVQSDLHNVTAAIVRHVRNLRSQVARAACQRCVELFTNLKRATETDLEEMVGPLLHRTADTNKFLRQDCNAALDAMVENVSPPKAVSVIVTKGAAHQNALVRAVAARLLALIVTRLGADKVFHQVGKDTRNRIIKTGAQLLTEGSLETRTHAKQLFMGLVAHEEFDSVFSQVVPPPILRSVQKSLTAIRKESSMQQYNGSAKSNQIL